MESKIQVPNNIEDKTVLKRFLTQLVLGINGNPLFSGNVTAQNQALVNILQTNPNVDFLNVVSKLNELRTDILTYVEENVETIILQQQEDIAVIAEQFGTFYQQALAASWYGLSVKAGGAVAGLEVGSLDPDVTTPGDENSYFRVIADNFIVGRAYEDLTQEEKDYLAANNLPSFGTVYNAQKQPVPALITSWDSVNQTYKHYFNGIVQFSNVTKVPNFVLDTALSNALVIVNADITTAQNSANSANALLAEIASDNKLTANEKINTKKEWDIIVSEYSKNITQANTYIVSTTAYTNAYNSLNTYISSLLTSLTTTSDIVGTTFRSMFKDYYDARTDLLNAIATKIKNDLDTQISNLTKVEDINWQQQVQSAINNNATTIDGGKIVTNQAFVNNLNAVGGVVADTITGNELNGTVINGARINGSVIKTSYLDLDGELEVLTNYHITVAMYNANPSLYTDAVYISADNEYRIPSMSTLSSLEKVVSSSSSPWVAVGSYTLSSGLYSYATANVGHNMKAVKPRPSIINFSESGSSGGLSNNTLYSAVFDGKTSGYFKFFIGNLLILSLTISNTSVSYSGLVGSGSIEATIGGTTTVNLSYCGMSFVVRRGASYGMRIKVEYLGNTNMSISSDWTSSQIYVTSNSVLNPSGGNTLIGLRLPAISINNML